MGSVIGDLISVGRSKGVVIACGLMKAVLIARFLGPEKNGIIAALVIYPTLVMTVGSLGVRKSAAFLLGSGRYNERDVKSAVFVLWILSTVFSVICLFFLMGYTSKTEFSLTLLMLAISPVPFSLFITYASGLYLGRNEIGSFNRVNWLPPFITVVMVAVLVGWVKLSIEGVLIAELLGVLVMGVLLFFRLDFSVGIQIKGIWLVVKDLLKLGVAYAVSLLVLNLNYRLDVILLDRFANPYEIGIYSKGAVLSQYLWEVPMLLGTIVFARGARAKDRRLFSLRVCQLLRISLLLIGLGCLFLFALGGQIIELLFSSAFAESASVMRLLLPGVFLLTIFKVLNMDMSSQGRPWFAMKAMVPALVVNVLLNILLIPMYGADGAAFASTISYICGAILFLFHYRKASGLLWNEILGFSLKDFSELGVYFNKIKVSVRR